MSHLTWDVSVAACTHLRIYQDDMLLDKMSLLGFPFRSCSLCTTKEVEEVYK